MAALLLHRCGHVKDNVHMAGQLWWFQQHLFRRDVNVEQLRDWSLVFFQIPLLVLGSRQTFTVKQPVLWSRVWGDSWPPTSPTRRSTSSHLTMLLFFLRYIYLTVKIHNRNDVIGGVSNVWAATFEFILYVVWRYLIFLLIRKRQCSLQIAVRGPLADQTRPTDNKTNYKFLGVPKLFHARREMLGIIQL